MSNEMMFIRNKKEGLCQAMDFVQIPHLKQYPSISLVNRALLPSEKLTAYKSENVPVQVLIRNQKEEKYSLVEVFNPHTRLQKIILTTEDIDRGVKLSEFTQIKDTFYYLRFIP